MLVEKWLRRKIISLHGSSVKGTRRRSSFTGLPEGYVEDGSGDRYLFPWGPVREPGRGPYTRDFDWGMNLKAL